MAPSRVAVVGGGVAGASVAIFLKTMGHEPIIFERNVGIPDEGLDISIPHSDLAALARVPGLLEHLGGSPLVEWFLYSELVSEMGAMDVGSRPRCQGARAGLGAARFSKSVLQRRLVEFAAGMGVAVRWGHELVGLQQDDAGVTVKFANGSSERVGFVVGCDGLHSATRRCLFGRQPARFTGVSQYGANSRTESRIGHRPRVVLVGGAAHRMNLPVGENGAFKDAGLLAELLEKHSWTATEPFAAPLEAIFMTFESACTAQAKEPPRVTRAQGDLRIPCGVDQLSALLAATALGGSGLLCGS
ncbi:hypothetical protein PsYK624_111960 [Phanerochaete sordida]|uniref:FAD-binding domain-containing protein n=1 Tax=Phanerochaete sordida TaxID=48140 RepID=A0A9P3GG54_9APHY|nr:hypothetical protein PsYK624_111960 [Phanerochaete sordida]